MTAAEKADLQELRGEVREGFKEIRDLIEARRRDDMQAHQDLDARLRLVEGFAVSQSAVYVSNRRWIATAMSVSAVAISAVGILATQIHL